MPCKRRPSPRDPDSVEDFRHAEARRKNNPPAGIAPTYEVRERQTARYAYDPHLAPSLNFDRRKVRDELGEVIERGLAATTLEGAKAALQILQKAQEPYLDWAGKAEHTSFEVDVVSLHIHERISTKAILDAVRRPEPIQPDCSRGTPLPAVQEVEFYRHEVNTA